MAGLQPRPRSHPPHPLGRKRPPATRPAGPRQCGFFFQVHLALERRGRLLGVSRTRGKEIPVPDRGALLRGLLPVERPAIRS
jgi:hypothetical protein